MTPLQKRIDAALTEAIDAIHELLHDEDGGYVIEEDGAHLYDMAEVAALHSRLEMARAGVPEILDRF